MPQATPELTQAAAAVGLTIDTVLRRTGKTLLARGTFADVPVAVKYLVDPDPFWADKWRHELDVYEIFAETPPPVPVPRLLHTDHDRLLVLEWIDGYPLADERYPQRPLEGPEVDRVLGTITSLNGWAGPACGLTPTFDYPERITRYHAKGYLANEELGALQRLLEASGAPTQINHGDPLASNILIQGTGEAALLDWEFTGPFLPGFDLAMIHTQLGTATPAIRARVDEIVADKRIEESFAVNLAVVLTRELRLHRDLPEDDPVRLRCLPLIELAWAATSDRIQRLVAGRPR